MAVRIFSKKTGKEITLLNPSEKATKFAYELKGNIATTNEGVVKVDKNGNYQKLTDKQRAFRSGYLTSRTDSANAYKAKNKVKSSNSLKVSKTISPSKATASKPRTTPKKSSPKLTDSNKLSLTNYPGRVIEKNPKDQEFMDKLYYTGYKKFNKRYDDLTPDQRTDVLYKIGVGLKK